MLPGMVAHAFNPITPEAEAGGFLSSRPAWSQSEFQDSQDYTERPCLEKNKKQKTKKKTKKEFNVRMLIFHQLPFHLTYKILSFYVYACFTYEYVPIAVPSEARRGHLISWR